jgi:hypothetical protein
MIMGREQQKSKLEKHGEGKAHAAANDRLVNILLDAGWEVHPNCGFTAQSALITMWGTAIKRTGYDHEWDVYAIKKHDNGLTTELIIEIDGSSHNSKVQMGKDIIAENYAKFFLPNAYFKRIPIEALIDKKVALTNTQILESLFR